MGSSLVVFIFFTVICLSALALIMLFEYKHSGKTHVRHTPNIDIPSAHAPKTGMYVPPISEESLDYLKVYE